MTLDTTRQQLNDVGGPPTGPAHDNVLCAMCRYWSQGRCVEVGKVDRRLTNDTITAIDPARDWHWCKVYDRRTKEKP